MNQFDLVVRNGTVVTAGSTAVTDVGIRGEKVAQLGGDMEGHRELDAGGLLVLPGMVDIHTHLSLQPDEVIEGEPNWVDDYESGTASALAGGVTTVGNMVSPAPGETPLQALEREAADVRAQAHGDVVLHPVLSEVTPAILDSIPEIMAQGYNSIKIFMCTPNFERDIAGYVQAIATAGRAGMLTIIHCEDYGLLEYAAAELAVRGQTDLRYYAESRPVSSESVATERAVAISTTTGAPILVVHLSSEAALEACRRGQAQGAPVFVETRPLYLHLTSERFLEPEGPKYVGQPPLREASDVNALWAGIAQGTIHTIGSDHAPWMLDAKLDPALSVTKLRPGVANLEEELAMLYSEGVKQDRISVERLVEITATNPARLAGLYPRKGTIAVGSDADIVLLDPELTRPVEAPKHSRSDYSAFEGWSVTGWPVVTVLRGQVVYEDGELLSKPGNGRLIRRSEFRAP